MCRFELWRSLNGRNLALKLDGSTASFLETDVQQDRFAGQFSQGIPMESGLLNTALELGLLVRSDVDTGVELSGRSDWQGHTGLSVFGQGHVFLLGDTDRSDWGLGGGLRYSPSEGGEGLMMSVEPSIGITSRQLSTALWSNAGADALSIAFWPASGQLKAELAYGFTTDGGLLRNCGWCGSRLTDW